MSRAPSSCFWVVLAWTGEDQLSYLQCFQNENEKVGAMKRNEKWGWEAELKRRKRESKVLSLRFQAVAGEFITI